MKVLAIGKSPTVKWREAYERSKKANDIRGGIISFFHLVLLQPENFNLKKEELKTIKAFLASVERPEAIAASSSDASKAQRFSNTTIGSTLFLDTVLNNRDSVGDFIPLSSKAYKILKDIAWAQGFYFFRPAFSGHIPSFFDMFLVGNKLVKEIGLERVAETLGIEDDLFLQHIGHEAREYKTFEVAKGKRKGKFIPLILRPAIFSFALMWGGIHTYQLADRYSDETINSGQLFRDLKTHIPSSLDGKSINVVVSKEMFDSFWSGDSSKFVERLHYLVGTKENSGTNFRIQVFRSEDELASLLNEAGQEDLLIVIDHGAAGKLKSVQNMNEFIGKVENNPLKPGANMVWFSCSFGNCWGLQGIDFKLEKEEPWILLSRKKLNPREGKAIASTVPVAVSMKGRYSEGLLTTIMEHSLLAGLIGSPGLYWIRHVPVQSSFDKNFMDELRRQFGYGKMYDRGTRIYDRSADETEFIPHGPMFIEDLKSLMPASQN